MLKSVTPTLALTSRLSLVTDVEGFGRDLGIAKWDKCSGHSSILRRKLQWTKPPPAASTSLEWLLCGNGCVDKLAGHGAAGFRVVVWTGPSAEPARASKMELLTELQLSKLLQLQLQLQIELQGVFFSGASASSARSPSGVSTGEKTRP
jgi:hypothetical protein